MTDQLPDPAEDLTGYYAPHPPIRCAAFADAGPQDGPGGGRGGPGGVEVGSESPEAAAGAQAGADGLDRLRRLRNQLAAEQAKHEAADATWLPDLDCLRVTPSNGIATGIAAALHLIDGHLREAARTTPDNPATSSDTADNLHARLVAALLPAVQRETAQLRTERDMALNAARDARAANVRVRAYAQHAIDAGSNGPGIALGRTLLGLLDGAGKEAA